MIITFRTYDDGLTGYRQMVKQKIVINTLEEFYKIFKNFEIHSVTATQEGFSISVYNNLKNWPIAGTVFSMLDGKEFIIRR